MRSNVSFQIERIVEALGTVRALVFLVRRVVPSMSVQHAHMLKALAAQVALVFVVGGASVSACVSAHVCLIKKVNILYEK